MRKIGKMGQKTGVKKLGIKNWVHNTYLPVFGDKNGSTIHIYQILNDDQIGESNITFS